jgi:succinoglycan biosynthesis protein ExoA
MEPDARVCLIMPFLNEVEHLPAVLQSLGAQTFAAERLALIAVDNGSSDGSAALVERWLHHGPVRGELQRVEPPSIPHALNAAIARVPTGSYVVRIDAHTRYAPDYVATIMTAFAQLGPEVWCVGGSPEAIAAAGFGTQLHAALFNNPMGLGPAAYRNAGRTGPVASVYLGAWRPGVLERVGGYDEAWHANEDAELAERIREAGGSVVRVEARSEKFITRGALGALRQWSRYGYWRARTILRHPRSLRWRHLAPPAAVVAGVVLAATPPRRLLAVLFAGFAVLTVALRRRGEPPAVTAASLIYFPLVHAGFGAGMLVGLVAGAAEAATSALRRRY